MAQASTTKRGRALDQGPRIPPPVLPEPAVDPEEAALVEFLARNVPAPPPILAHVPSNGRYTKADREAAVKMAEGMKTLASDQARAMLTRVYTALGEEKLNKLLKAAGGENVFDAHKNVAHALMAIMAQPEMMVRLIEWGFSQPGTLAAIISKWAPKDAGLVLNADKALVLLPQLAASREEWQAEAAKHGFGDALVVQGELADGAGTITFDGFGGG